MHTSPRASYLIPPMLLSAQVLLARSAREGMRELMKEWRQQQQWPDSSQVVGRRRSRQLVLSFPHSPQFLLVKRTDLDQLVSEAMMLKEFLPSLLTPEHLSAVGRLTTAEQSESSL